MIQSLIFAIFLLVPGVASAFGSEAGGGLNMTLEDARHRCTPPNEADPILYSTDFEWGLTLDQMKEKFNKVYNSPKRLYRRAYFDPDRKQFFLQVSYKKKDYQLRIPEGFIKSIVRHIEEALRAGYAQYVFRADMGHAHFYIPEWTYQNQIAEVTDQAERVQKMIELPDLKMLYHTAEQLSLLDREHKLLNDPYLQWRFLNRNILGDNQARGELEVHKNLTENSNTVQGIDGYVYYSPGFKISANGQGCFPFRGPRGVEYFDLSFHDLPMDPNHVRDRSRRRE